MRSTPGGAPAPSHLTRIAELLEAIDAPGAFATSTTASAAGLRVAVREVGPLSWPLRRSDAQRLIAVARPARYGLRDRTKLDARVRDTWEIPAARVTVEEKSRRRIIDPMLARIGSELGLQGDARLRASLHNLLVYQPGQFFRSHQDSEKTDDMIGTLVLILPSTFTGGALVVEHDRKKRVFRGAPGRLTFIAFYADCHHQVQPVKAGYRVALTYNLMLEGASAAAAPADANLDALVKSANAYFRAPRPSTFGGLREPDVPDRLVYLLDHQYTRRTLGWNRLKRADALRAAALREVADRLDCEIALALADVHEHWSSEDVSFGYRGRWDDRQRWGFDQDDDDLGEDDEGAIDGDGGDGPPLIELLESEIALRHWLDAGGRPMKGETVISADEVCSTRESADFRPFSSEHEGYMGNWGNTVDRWYHRAAVVLWPRSRAFVIRAKGAPAWAVRELLKMAVARGGRDDARRQTRAVAPFWSDVASMENSRGFFEQTLKLALALDDAGLAASLLQPLRLESLSPKAAASLPPLIDRYGLAWAKAAAHHWMQRRDSAGEAAHPTWLAGLPAVCRAVRPGSPSEATTFAQWLVREQWTWLSAEQRAAAALTPPSAALAEMTRFAPACLGVIEASRVLRDADLHREIVAFLTPGDAAYPVEAAVHLLRSARREAVGDEIARFGLEALRSHCASLLTTRLQTPVREPGNWSIAVPARCRCTLCRTLGEFLSAANRIQFDWPLAQEARRHVHGIIDAHDLPVTHTTRRTGRPFTLVLRKTEALFARDAAQRRKWQQDLAWLRVGSTAATGAR